MRTFTSCGSGVMALAVTPPGEFGDLRTVQGFKPRFETALWLGPVRIAGEYYLCSGDGKVINSSYIVINYFVLWKLYVHNFPLLYSHSQITKEQRGDRMNKQSISKLNNMN